MKHRFVRAISLFAVLISITAHAAPPEVLDDRFELTLFAEHPEIVAELKADLRRIVENGRSTPGPKQPNHDGKVHWLNLPW